MEVYSTFQREFMQTLSCVQEVCVQTALCQQEGTLEEQFYNTTAEGHYWHYGNDRRLCKPKYREVKRDLPKEW